MVGAPLYMKLAGSSSLLAIIALASTACIANSLPVGMLDDSSDTDAATTSDGATSVEPPPTTSSDPDSDTSSDLPDGACDIFDPTCPAGQKCMPWSTAGDETWNAWGCYPVVEDPAGIGEPCHLLGDLFTGLDDCEEGSMCWELDPETQAGTCVPFCTIGAGGGVECAEPDHYCFIDDFTPYLCSTSCDIFEQDCPAGEGCYPSGGMFDCAPDASGAAGAYGDACEANDECDPGLVCLPSSVTTQGQPCNAAEGCCTEMCKLDSPLGDDQCSGQAAGQTCVSWFAEGADLPDELLNIGVCALP